MKLEKTHYVIMRLGNIDLDSETEYLSYDSENNFTNDIRDASKFANRSAALYAKTDYCVNKHYGCDLDMNIIPVKVTYEW
jgi:hypothetical protein